MYLSVRLALLLSLIKNVVNSHFWHFFRGSVRNIAKALLLSALTSNPLLDLPINMIHMTHDKLNLTVPLCCCSKQTLSVYNCSICRPAIGKKTTAAKKRSKTTVWAVGKWCNWRMPEHHVTPVTLATLASQQETHLPKVFLLLFASLPAPTISSSEISNS